MENHDFAVISDYSVDDAIEDGSLIDTAVPPPVEVFPDLADIDGMDSYLKIFGKILGQKAIHALKPLHVPGRDELPDLSDLGREPFPCQAHVIAAGVKMLDKRGSGFIVGEMGVGKTLLGMAAAHMHASRPRRKGGMNGNYRAMVLCPDHLIGKWEREILETIPSATVIRFGPRSSFDDPMPDKGRRTKGTKKPKVDPSSKQTLRDTISLLEKADLIGWAKKRWSKPQGAEWYVMGRNQAKWLSDWAGIADVPEGKKALSMKHVVVDKVTQVNEKGYAVCKPDGRVVMKYVTAPAFRCPSCGNVIRNQKGAIIGAKDLSAATKNSSQKKCESYYLVAEFDPEKPNKGPDKLYKMPGKVREHAFPGKEVNHLGRKWVVRKCDEPLYNYTSRPYRWAPARIVQKKLRNFFRYLVIDEVHEHKSDESAQSMACGKLMASVKHILALTGTIIGGYADHLFPLLMRISGQSLRDEGYEWGKDLPFSEVYGKIERVVTTSEDVSTSVRGNSKSMRRAKTGKATEKKYVRPGIMPPLFGNHLLGSSIFLTLEELASELPDLFEYIGGEVGQAPEPEEFSDDEKYEDAADNYRRMEGGWFDTACDMEPDQRDEYNRVAAILEYANKDLIKKGSMKLLGAMLWTLMDYPDRPFGWEHDPELLKALGDTSAKQAPALLGQSFLKKFHHRFDPETESLLLTKDDDNGNPVPVERIPLRKDGGVYYLDVVFNGKHSRQLIYDTGASCVSLPAAMADEIGLAPKKGDHESGAQIADGSVVSVRMTTIDSVTVGSFAVEDVECGVVPPGGLPHTVGYWKESGIRTEDNWIGVVTPRSLPQDVVYPKEQRLIDICKRQKKDGRQTWVYVQMTGKRNVQPRLKMLLEREGLRVGVLRSKDVEPREREEWIAAHGREFDVMISHPQLVSTGLDLFSKAQGGHNYATLIFYETGYNLFTMKQASRRAWRIGQPHDCRVYYLYYKGTMQHKAMSVMSKKMAALDAVNGDFSADGLAAMAGDDNLQMTLAKNLSEKIDSSDMQRSWAKVKSGGTKKKKPGTALVDAGKSVEPSLFDNLPIEVQMVVETIIEDQGEPIPADALIEFPGLAERLAQVDAGFEVVAEDFDEEPDPGLGDDMTGADLHAFPFFKEMDERKEADAHAADFDHEEEEADVIQMSVVASEEPESEEEDEAPCQDFWDEDDEEEDEYEIPELTPDIMAKMFANMRAAGLSV